ESAPSVLSTLSLHAALPISLTLDVLEGAGRLGGHLTFGQNQVTPHVDDLFHMLVHHRASLFAVPAGGAGPQFRFGDHIADQFDRSEEHTCELQSRENLVCRL